MGLLENVKVLAGGLGAAILRPEERQMPNLLENCKRLDYDPDQPRDENGRWGYGGSGSSRAVIRARGPGTREAKEHLKSLGYKFNSQAAAWDKEVDLPHAVDRANIDREYNDPKRVSVSEHIVATNRRGASEIEYIAIQKGTGDAFHIHEPYQMQKNRDREDIQRQTHFPEFAAKAAPAAQSRNAALNAKGHAEAWTARDASPRGVRSEAEHKWRIKNDPDYL